MTIGIEIDRSMKFLLGLFLLLGFVILVFGAALAITLDYPANNTFFNVNSVNFTCTIADDPLIINISLFTNTTGTFRINSTIQNEMYVVDNAATIWKSNDLGVTWVNTTSDYNGADGNQQTVYLISDSNNSLFIIEDDDDIWKSSDDGISWTKVNDDYNGEGQHAQVAVADNNDYLYIIEGDEDVWRSVDSGVNWNKVNGTNFNGASGNAKGVATNSSGTIFIVDNTADIWESNDDGIIWRNIKDDFNGADPNPLITYMAVDGKENLFIIEDDDDIWKSSDDGISWTKVNDDYNGEGQHAQVAVADNNDYLYIIEGDEDVWRSVDSGVNWNKVNGTNFNGASGNAKGIAVLGNKGIPITSSYEANFTINNIADGTYLWNCFAVDNETNSSFASSNFTFTLDTITPIISNISEAIISNSGTIAWATNELSNSSVAYGVTEDLGSYNSSANLVTSHSTDLSGLSSSTLYYYNITSCDQSNNCATNGTFNFTTTAIDGGSSGGNTGEGGSAPSTVRQQSGAIAVESPPNEENNLVPETTKNIPEENENTIIREEENSAKKEASFFQKLRDLISLTWGIVLYSAKSTSFDRVIAIGILFLLASYAIYGEILSFSQRRRPKKPREEIYGDLERLGFKVKR